MTYKSKSHLCVEAMKADVKANRLISGFTIEGEGETFKGCWIGCTLREYDHDKMAERLNWPLCLVHISEAIFERLNDRAAEQAFAVDVLAAPKPNADVSLIPWQFLHWAVSAALEQMDKKTQAACTVAVELLHKKALGIKVHEEEVEAGANTFSASTISPPVGLAVAFAAFYAPHTRYANRAAYATHLIIDFVPDYSIKQMGAKLIELLQAAPVE